MAISYRRLMCSPLRWGSQASPTISSPRWTLHRDCEESMAFVTVNAGSEKDASSVILSLLHHHLRDIQILSGNCRRVVCGCPWGLKFQENQRCRGLIQSLVIMIAAVVTAMNCSSCWSFNGYMSWWTTVDLLRGMKSLQTSVSMMQPMNLSQ